MILAIESSCDDSSIAVFSKKDGIVAERVHSQLDLHEQYGGVVPALASREHMRNLPLLLVENKSLVALKDITQVAVTIGPGLAGCLALGVGMAKAVATFLDVPLAGVNHLHGHAYSPFITLHQSQPGGFSEAFQDHLPHLGLIASGGNTILFEIDPSNNLNILAQTVDDAAGEALDKGGKLLGLPYPAGPVIEKHALSGNPSSMQFPHAFKEKNKPCFSFSGLKTSLRYHIEKTTDDALKSSFDDICAAYQHAVLGALTHKTKQFLEDKSYRSLGLSGGIANNKKLRSLFSQLASQYNTRLLIAEPKHTTDNAAMIAFSAFANPQQLPEPLTFNPSLPLA